MIYNKIIKIKSQIFKELFNSLKNLNNIQKIFIFFLLLVFCFVILGNFKNKFDLTFKLNKILENMIIKNPGQWIWTHDRWK